MEDTTGDPGTPNPGLKTLEEVVNLLLKSFRIQPGEYLMKITSEGTTHIKKYIPSSAEMSTQAVLSQINSMETNLDAKMSAIQEAQIAYLDSVKIKSLAETLQASPIFNGIEGHTPERLSFLSSRLSQFTKATRIFTTKDYVKTNVAAEFHQACDNIPNTLVIIKSGQYIAGGYTEVAWSSPATATYVPSKSLLGSFLFSVTHQKLYALSQVANAIYHSAACGPIFGSGHHINIADNYKSGNGSNLTASNVYASPAGQPTIATELFGVSSFAIDEYEVYKLE